MVDIVVSVPVANTDKKMLIDVADYERFKLLQFFTSAKEDNVIVAVNRTITGILRLILDAPHGLEVDHINHNTFDNRRSNLRLCTASQNHFSRRKVINDKTSSQFKGVNRTAEGRWQARVVRDGRQLWLGNYEKEEDAARVHDREAVKSAGEFALLNFPEEDNSDFQPLVEQKPSSSKFRGVSFYKRTGKWIATISRNNKAMHLGYFNNEEDAARAYDAAARMYHGKKARLNFPDDV